MAATPLPPARRARASRPIRGSAALRFRRRVSTRGRGGPGASLRGAAGERARARIRAGAPPLFRKNAGARAICSLTRIVVGGIGDFPAVFILSGGRG